MSCPHGNHEESCDLCDEVDAAYKSGYEAGGKVSVDLTMKHLRRAEKAEAELDRIRKVKVPEEPIYFRLWREIPKHEIPLPIQLSINYIDTLLDLLRRETVRADTAEGALEFLSKMRPLRDASDAERAEKAEAERDALKKDAERFRGLQNMDPKVAQSFFWNYTSRKQRAAAIDAAMGKVKP